MRHTLFRGMTPSGEWTYGDLLTDIDAVTIVTDGRDNGIHVYVKRGLNVIPESVGQYIGIDDVNNKEIFEGHKVKYSNDLDDIERVGVVAFRNGSFVIESPEITSYRLTDYSIEIVGDVYEG